MSRHDLPPDTLPGGYESYAEWFRRTHGMEPDGTKLKTKFVETKRERQPGRQAPPGRSSSALPPAEAEASSARPWTGQEQPCPQTGRTPPPLAATPLLGMNPTKMASFGSGYTPALSFSPLD
jgi:hypothetical protein